VKKVILLLMICGSVINFALFDKIKKEIRWKEEEKPSFNDIKVTIKGEEKYKKYDTVLFQLDSEYDENTKKWKVCIGDAGVINFFINREKLKNKDFTEILYNWDCY